MFSRQTVGAGDCIVGYYCHGDCIVGGTYVVILMLVIAILLVMLFSTKFYVGGPYAGVCCYLSLPIVMQASLIKGDWYVDNCWCW